MMPTPNIHWLTYAIFAIQIPIWVLSARNIIRLRRIRGHRNPTADNHSRAAARTSTIDAARAAYVASRDADAKRGTGGPREGTLAGLTGPVTTVPDMIEPVVGYRSWKVLPTGQLHACAQSVAWPLGAPIIATCAIGGKHTAVPAAPCSCGVYAAKSLHTVPMPHAEAMAWGTVSLWGRVCEYSAGYRAQYAYPKDIILVFGPHATYTVKQKQLILEHLRSNYDVPVRMGTISDLIEFVEKKT